MRAEAVTAALAGLLLVGGFSAAPAAAADLAVTGVVTLDGVGVAATEVGWFDPTTGVSGETLTAPDGSYALTVADGHPYVLYAGVDHNAKGRWIPLGGADYLGSFVGANGSDYLYQSLTPFITAGVQNIAPTHPGSIVGKAKGLAGKNVWLETVVGHRVATTTASSTGRYEFTGLIPGRYRFFAFRVFQSYERYESGDLVVAAGTATRHDPKLVKTGTITGIVTMGGKPVKSAFVVVANADAENGHATDENGRYTIKNVASGTVKLVFNGQGLEGTGDYFYRGYQKVKSVSLKPGAKKSVSVTIPKPAGLTLSVTPSKGAKNFSVRIVDGGDYPVVDHYVKVGSKKGAIPVSLPGIRGGSYTLVITDNTRTHYYKTKIRIAYGKTTALGAVALSKKTVSISGTISGSKPHEMAFTNEYSSAFDLTLSGNKYRLTGLVPGSGVLSVRGGGYSKPKPYFTENVHYPIALKKTITKDVSSGGPQVGLLTGAVTVGGLPVGSGFTFSGEKRPVPLTDFDYRYNLAYSVGGKLVGQVEIDGPTVYTLTDQYQGWAKEFITGAPFWLDLPGGSITLAGQRGTTVDVGTIQLEVRR